MESVIRIFDSAKEHILAHVDVDAIQAAYSSIPLSNAQLGFGALITWLLLVRSVRWRKYNAVHAKYAAKWNGGKGKITPQEAQEIIRVPMMWDMPFLVSVSRVFGVLKTAAVPSVSKLFVATQGGMNSPEKISRRFIDTQIGLATMITCPLSGFLEPGKAEKNQALSSPRPAEDPRASIAIARINWLHRKYKITNDEYLYFLALFMLETPRWIERYGWRSLSPLEKHAHYVVWRDIGEKMDVEDIPSSFEGMEEWLQEFADQHVAYEETNTIIAGTALNELLYPVPKMLKGVFSSVALSLLDNQYREAYGIPSPSPTLKIFVHTFMKSAMLFQRFFLLPRCSPSIEIVPLELPTFPQGTCPRLHPASYPSRPWYVSEPTTTFGGLSARLSVALGFTRELPSPHLSSHGYRLEEMGPQKYEKDGHEEVFVEAEKLCGCPIAGPLSLQAAKASA